MPPLKYTFCDQRKRNLRIVLTSAIAFGLLAGMTTTASAVEVDVYINGKFAGDGESTTKDKSTIPGNSHGEQKAWAKAGKKWSRGESIEFEISPAKVCGEGKGNGPKGGCQQWFEKTLIPELLKKGGTEPVKKGGPIVARVAITIKNQKGQQTAKGYIVGTLQGGKTTVHIENMNKRPVPATAKITDWAIAGIGDNEHWKQRLTASKSPAKKPSKKTSKKSTKKKK